MDELSQVMSAAGSTISTGVDTAANIYQFIYGLQQLKKAKELEKNNVRPTYEVNKNILKNQDTSEMLAGGGLPDAEVNSYYENANRLLSSSIGAVQNYGGGTTGLNTISDLYKSQLTEFGKVLAMDAAQHVKNLEGLMTANTAVADEEKTAFDYNKNMKYQETVNSINKLKEAGPQNIVGSIRNEADTVNTMFGNTNYTSNKGMTEQPV